MISSYGENAEFERQMLSGELDVELTLKELLLKKMRCTSRNTAFLTSWLRNRSVAEGESEFNGKCTSWN
jgi:3-oxoacid CoA-transferase subunit A